MSRNNWINLFFSRFVAKNRMSFALPFNLDVHRMSEIEIKEFTELTGVVVDLLVELEKKIFDEPLSREVFHRELKGRPNLSILVGYIQGDACGYKIGFEYHSDHEYFYSWNGGIIPNYRRRGIASALMARQHEIAKAKGFRYIRTQTKNKYRNMLLLNIKEGFEVTGVYKKLREKQHGIILEREL